ncbi:glucan endo-1,3-beta-glucosidase-like [Vicia villosa]|uniref:glucan endo-1,3-beta-glucosidase-like n=1 Tax=Vicia villosa TaxID=3911 RepID=UPI00273AE935|nr:glucan endo-1,3-beta-glucosidase-like [Vicia villosa]
MVFSFVFLMLIGLETTATAHSIGVCYGRVANNLPPADEVIDLFQSSGIGRMRIYDPDHATLQALRGSNIELVIGTRNEDIKSIAKSVSVATEWIQINILKYSQDVKFRYIVVGNEIDPTSDEISNFVLLAMQNIYTALTSSNLQNKIKISTAIQLNLLGSSYPPSSGAFSKSATPYITPIVKFLVDTKAPLLANVYTYFSYISDPTSIDISYALFTSESLDIRDGSVKYQNLFDATLGAIYAALNKVGGANLEVVVSESGWPSDGGVAATVENAQTYYENLIKHVSKGNPARPNQPLETYLFAMFDENQKGPAATERHFGLFSPDKQIKYQISELLKSDIDPSTSGSSSFTFKLDLIEDDALLKNDLWLDSEGIMDKRREATARFWLNLRIKENMLIQKSRLKWLNNGDTNRGFFHIVMKDRRRHNFIGSINSNRGILDSVAEVKEEVFNHFESKFRESDSYRPILEGNFGGRLSHLDRFGDVKEDFRRFFRDFHGGALLSKFITSSFLSLIPKFSSPFGLEDYRPICIVGCLYKALSKLLASRLKAVLDAIVSPCQSANPTKEFLVEKGLRQGDMLSPFLFVIMAEALPVLVKRSMELGDFVGININKNCGIDILIFTEYTLLVGNASWKHIWAVKSV